MRKVIIFFFCFFIFCPFFSFASSDHIVISEVQIAGDGTKDEFVELYNPTDNSFNLSSWRLSRKTASGNKYNLLTSFPDIEIKPRSFLVIAHPVGYKNSSDLIYSTSSSIAADNTVILYSDNGKTVVDKVGFGLVVDYEGVPAEVPPSGKSIIRLDLVNDSDNNSQDFSIADPSPGGPNSDDFRGNNVSSGLSQTGDLWITELFPDPISPQKDSEDEFIEIYNNSSFDVNLSGWTISDKEGSVKKYVIPEGTVISAYSFLVFYSRDTKISLNNSGDAAELYDKDGNLVDSTPNYEEILSGKSFSFDGENWVWTHETTPGKNNIISEISEEESLDKSKKKKSKNKLSKNKKSKSSKKPKGKIKGIATKKNRGGNEGFPYEFLGVKDNRTLGILFIAAAFLVGTSYLIYLNKDKIKDKIVLLKQKE